MAGRKQHFIQRLLLKGFSYDAPRDPCHVWVYRRSGKPFPTALDGYGAERDFYGDPDKSNLDSRITNLESDCFNDFLIGMRDGADGSVDPVQAAAFAIHVFARSKNLRSMFTAGAEPLMARFREYLRTEGMLERLVESGMRENPGLFREKLGIAGVPAWKIAEIEPQITALYPTLAKAFVTKQRHVIDAFLDQFQGQVRDLVADGHRKTLHDRLHDFSGTRSAQLGALKWQTITVQQDLVLGDSVVFVELADGSFKPATEPDDALSRVWLPITAKRVLVGSSHNEEPVIHVPRINHGAAACSFDAFCASEGPDRHASLVPAIRTATFSLDATAIDQIAKEAITKLLK